MQPLDYNPMQNFNNVFNSQMYQINNDTMKLNGSVEMTVMPDEVKNDPQLKSDLKLLSNQGAGKVAGDFKTLLSNSLNDLNTTQRNSEAAIETFATGGDIDVHTVMLAAQKASLSMQMAMQLRNKAVQAYESISKMNI